MTAKLCNVCNIRRPKTGSKGLETSPHNDMCNYCFEEGGWENTHSDAGHEYIDLANMTPEQKAETGGCWICFPELNLAQKTTSLTGTTKAKKQGDRRPQLNHKGHSHPATPAARRECKKAFWAVIKAGGDMVGPNLQAAMDKWDSHLDGHGKPVQPAKVFLAPLGPKGGFGHSMKVVQEKVAASKGKGN